MAIATSMSGKTLDLVLKAINDIQNALNNGKVIYIKNGNPAFESGEALFDVIDLTAQG